MSDIAVILVTVYAKEGPRDDLGLEFRTYDTRPVTPPPITRICGDLLEGCLRGCPKGEISLPKVRGILAVRQGAESISEEACVRDIWSV